MVEAEEPKSSSQFGIWVKGICLNLAVTFLIAFVLSIAWTIWAFMTGKGETQAWSLLLGPLVLPFFIGPFVGLIFSGVVLILHKKFARFAPYTYPALACLIFWVVILLFAIFGDLAFVLFDRLLTSTNFASIV